MRTYIRKSCIVQAEQWPDIDRATKQAIRPMIGDNICLDCSHPMSEHGQFINGSLVKVLHPGDYVIYAANGAIAVSSKRAFRQEYDEIDQTMAFTNTQDNGR